MPDSTIEIKLDNFFVHIDKRFDNIESALAILTMENKENSRKIIEHSILIGQNKIDIDRVGEYTRIHEKNCQVENMSQHKKLFEKVDAIEKDITKIEKIEKEVDKIDGIKTYIDSVNGALTFIKIALSVLSISVVISFIKFLGSLN